MLSGKEKLLLAILYIVHGLRNILQSQVLEYSCAVWDTYLHKDIESVQSLACKICMKNWPASYSDHLCLPTSGEPT